MVATQTARRACRNHQRRPGDRRRSPTGCLTRRCCSSWWTARSESRRGSRWRGPARCRHAGSRSSSPPSHCRRGSDGGSGSGSRSHRAVRRSSRQARSPTGCCRPPRTPSTARARRWRPLARRSMSTSTRSAPRSVFAISSNGDDRYGQLTGQRRLRLAALQGWKLLLLVSGRRDHLRQRRPATGRIEAAPKRPRRARDPRRRHCPAQIRRRLIRRRSINMSVGTPRREPRAHGHARR